MIVQKNENVWVMIIITDKFIECDMCLQKATEVLVRYRSDGQCV